MVHMSIIEARLSQLGIRLSRWYKPEVRELQHILMPNEQIVTLSCGRYFGGYALLVATDQRLLLIDKKTFFMTVEDIRYDMVSEIDFSSRLLDSTLLLFTVNKQHRFTSMKYKKQLRDLTNYVQQRVMELRQYGAQPPAEEVKPERHRLSDLHLPHPRLPHPHLPHNLSLPSPLASIKNSAHVNKKVGAAAISGSRRINPYSGGSLITKHQWSRTSTPYVGESS